MISILILVAGMSNVLTAPSPCVDGFAPVSYVSPESSLRFRVSSLPSFQTPASIEVLVGVTNVSQHSVVWHQRTNCSAAKLFIQDSAGRMLRPDVPASCNVNLGVALGTSRRQMPGSEYVLSEPLARLDDPGHPGYVPISAWGYTKPLVPGSYTLRLISEIVANVGPGFIYTQADTLISTPIVTFSI